MAKKWEMKHTQTEVGFKVISVTKAHKPEYVVTTVEYDSNHKQYNYVRKSKALKEYPGWRATIVDGCEITYSAYDFEVINVKRIYDTAGLKKTVNPGGANKGIIENIKQEVEKKDIQIPEVPKNAIVPVNEGPVHHEQYDTIKTCLQSNIPIYLAGPAGSGKNYTVEQICDELGWEFYFSNSVQQEYKLTGFIDAGGDYHETEFYKACTTDKECVFFLDEMDASIPEVLVLLNAAIANGYFEFPTGRVQLENIHFVAAGNTVGNGADESYTGRMVLDQATLDRFAIIEFNYSMNIELKISEGNVSLVSFIHQLREISEQQGIRTTFSYRCITRIVKLESAGMDTRTALKIGMFGGLDQDTINTFNPQGDTPYHTALKQLQAA